VSPLLRSLIKSLGILCLMVVSGGVFLIVSAYVLVQLGRILHGDYEYYGRYPALLFAPAVVGFFAPPYVLWRLAKKDAPSQRALLRTVFIATVMICALAVLFGVLGLLRVF
jgi:hypothetical protein